MAASRHFRLSFLLLSSCLSFVQLVCFSVAVVCVGLGSLLPGPDGLCRLGSQGETITGERQREVGRGKEMRGEWLLTQQLGILSSFLMEGLMDMSDLL